MTDRQLLEDAAKAAGMIVIWHRGLPYDEEGEIWNPLTDRGDALQLSTALYLVVASMKATHEKPAFTAVYHFNGPGHASELHGSNATAATCRAITRAAAEIGRAMP